MTVAREREDVTVLMTGAGAPGAAGITKSLRSAGERNIRIVGTDVDPEAYGFALVDADYVVPAGDDGDYVDRIAWIVDEEAVDVIIPLTTAELEPLARNRDAIDAVVQVSPLEPLRIANDKARLYEFLESAGIDAAPAFSRVERKSEFVDAVEELGYPDRPVCFKPPVASGSRGFRVLTAGEGSADRLQRLLEEKPTTARTTLEQLLPVFEEASTFPELIVMEYLPGVEYSVDVLCHQDGIRPVIPRSRSRTRAGITFEGTIERQPDLIAQSRTICETLGLDYNVNLQFKYDADGEARLIEINPRVSGTIVMCVGAGANMPYLGVKCALGESIPAVGVDWGTKMRRYWQEVFTAPDGDQYHLDGANESLSAAPRKQ